MITGEELIAAIQKTLEPLPSVEAAWIGGSASFNRTDEHSDIDLSAVIADSEISKAYLTLETALTTHWAIKHKIEMPNPFGHSQRFYAFLDAPETLVLDVSFIPKTNPHRCLEIELHGLPKILFDKTGIVKPFHVDFQKDLASAYMRLDELKTAFDLFQHIPKKETARGRLVEAHHFYLAFTIRPLVEALRILHCPHRRMFHVRYIDFDLPKDVGSRLKDLWFPKDLNDLSSKRNQAEIWFYETLKILETKKRHNNPPYDGKKQ